MKEYTALNQMALTLASAKKDGEYILGPEVRVECPCYRDRNKPGIAQCFYCGTERTYEQRHSPRCQDCDGRGWTPLDPEKLGRWMVALMQATTDSFMEFIYWDDGRENSWDVFIFPERRGYNPGEADTPEEAFFTAATKALGLDTEVEVAAGD